MCFALEEADDRRLGQARAARRRGAAAAERRGACAQSRQHVYRVAGLQEPRLVGLERLAFFHQAEVTRRLHVVTA